MGNVNSEREKMDSVSLSVAGEKISCVPRRKKGIFINIIFIHDLFRLWVKKKKVFFLSRISILYKRNIDKCRKTRKVILRRKQIILKTVEKF